VARKRGGSAAIKIVDVAAAANVAPMTVSRVLNAPEQVSPATAARVREAIERLGYVPNLIAGGLSSRRSRMIAAIVPTIAHPMFSAPVQAFTDAMSQAGYHVLLGLSGYEGELALTGLIRAVLGRRPDGLLLVGSHHPPEVVRLLREAAVPVVEVFDFSPAPIDMLVGFDHREVGAAVARFFVGRGYTRFAVAGGNDARALARREGFVAAAVALGGTIVGTWTYAAPSGVGNGRDALRHLLPDLGAGTAVLCGSDMLALGMLTEARVRGIDVPGRLALCGFGDLELCRESEPAITSVAVDGAEIGRLAARSLLTRFAGETPPAPVLVPFHIVPRASS
jgi:LacI family gluconate utilization system Gnt-I transcriptional repressor